MIISLSHETFFSQSCIFTWKNITSSQILEKHKGTAIVKVEFDRFHLFKNLSNILLQHHTPSFKQPQQINSSVWCHWIIHLKNKNEQERLCKFCLLHMLHHNLHKLNLHRSKTFQSSWILTMFKQDLRDVISSSEQWSLWQHNNLVVWYWCNNSGWSLWFQSQISCRNWWHLYYLSAHANISHQCSASHIAQGHGSIV